ncbi:protease modulator HflC [Desulfonatronospira sp.]|uniref:protease modulator HflC n=1 Tax=Desulfonatronospira sp. TaxID=1962951 RepID=UPI0025BEEED0|nr:protease modulator HflC [Desulfonatronospira sp.]
MKIAAYLPVALILGVIVFFLSIFTVDEREYALVLQLGEHKRTIKEPGLHFKIPLIQSAILIDRRVQTSDVGADEFLTVDMERLLIDHITRWHVKDPLLFYMTVRNVQEAQGRIQNVVVAELRDVVSNESILNIIAEEREALMTLVSERARERIDDFGIMVNDVRMKRVDFPPEVEDNVFARMEAERERIAARHRAEGEEIAMEVRAQADADRQRILGEGEALATETFAEGFTEDILLLKDEEGLPVSGAFVTLNGRDIGMSDTAGRITVAFPKVDQVTLQAQVEREDSVLHGSLEGSLENGHLTAVSRSGELHLEFEGRPATYLGYLADEEFFRFLKSLSTYQRIMLPSGTTMVLSTDSELFDYLGGPGMPFEVEME